MSFYITNKETKKMTKTQERSQLDRSLIMKTSYQFILITTGFILTPVVVVYVGPLMGLALFAICAMKVALSFMEDL